MKKRFLILFLLCLICLPLACAKQPEPAPEPAPAVTAPAEREVKLKLPLGSRNDVAETIPAYTAGFSTAKNEILFYTVVSDDMRVAEGVLKNDGTLYVIAHGTGETKLTITAKTLSGEQASASVSVTVRDSRRTLALIVLGVLAVALLVLLGKPAAKKPEATAGGAAAKEAEPKTPTVIFEEEPQTPTVIFEEEPQAPTVIIEEEPKTPTVIFEEPKNDPERS